MHPVANKCISWTDLNIPGKLFQADFLKLRLCDQFPDVFQGMKFAGPAFAVMNGPPQTRQNNLRRLTGYDSPFCKPFFKNGIGGGIQSSLLPPHPVVVGSR
jgi:hypothetical protein